MQRSKALIEYQGIVPYIRLPKKSTEPCMRKISLLLIIVAFAHLIGSAQDEPIPPKRSQMVKVCLFGGFTPGMIFPNVKPINDFLLAGGGAPLKDNGVVMLGGGGAAYIMLVPNLRIGGLGMSGSISSASLDPASGIRRDAQLSIGYGGVTIEYVVPISERFDFAFGAMLGKGGIDLTIRKSNGGSTTWLGEQDYLGQGPGVGDLGSPPSNVTRILTGSFFVYVPSACFEYAITGWFAVRVGASYVGMAFPAWSVDSNYDLLGVPNNVNGHGFMANLALLVGTF